MVLIKQDSIHTAIEGIDRFYSYRVQNGAIVECTPVNVGDAATDHNFSQAGAITEHIVANSRDLKSVNRVRDADLRTGTGVARDGDSAVIDRVTEILRSHCDE